MLHHVSGFSCPLCNDKLLTADLKLRIWFNENVKPNYPQFHISWAYRNQQEQEEAVRNGKSRVHYPNSKHNQVDSNGKPCSLALDLFEIGTDGQALFPVNLYQRIAAGLDPEKMRWGGTFTFRDYDHFELIKKP